jgi:hypothetical protein
LENVKVREGSKLLKQNVTKDGKEEWTDYSISG